MVVSGGNNANLGATVYFDVGALSSDVADQSTANIASANAVNTVHQVAVAALALAGSGTVAGPAFDKANAANVLAVAAFDAANNAGGGGGYYKGNQGTVGDANNVGDIFRVNHSTLTANVTISESERAVAAGPLLIDTGVVLTAIGNGRIVIV